MREMSTQTLAARRDHMTALRRGANLATAVANPHIAVERHRVEEFMV
jgi:hypothetical protein